MAFFAACGERWLSQYRAIGSVGKCRGVRLCFIALPPQPCPLPVRKVTRLSEQAILASRLAGEAMSVGQCNCVGYLFDYRGNCFRLGLGRRNFPEALGRVRRYLLAV